MFSFDKSEQMAQTSNTLYLIFVQLTNLIFFFFNFSLPSAYNFSTTHIAYYFYHLSINVVAWHDVMKDEIQALRSNDTSSLVPFHPLMYVVGSYWVYKIKHCANGSIEHYKAQLVATSFTLQENIDYSETFSLVIKQATARLIFSIVVFRG